MTNQEWCEVFTEYKKQYVHICKYIYPAKKRYRFSRKESIRELYQRI